LLIRSINSSNSLVERPKRSSFVTTTTSSGISLAINLASCGRSALTSRLNRFPVDLLKRLVGIAQANGIAFALQKWQLIS
jgi:hypothetical protein